MPGIRRQISFGSNTMGEKLSHPNIVSKLVQTLVEAVEKNPEKHWKDSDFRKLSVDASTARRNALVFLQIQKEFGSFSNYVRNLKPFLILS